MLWYIYYYMLWFMLIILITHLYTLCIHFININIYTFWINIKWFLARSLWFCLFSKALIHNLSVFSQYTASILKVCLNPFQSQAIILLQTIFEYPCISLSTYFPIYQIDLCILTKHNINTIFHTKKLQNFFLLTKSTCVRKHWLIIGICVISQRLNNTWHK